MSGFLRIIPSARQGDISLICNDLLAVCTEDVVKVILGEAGIDPGLLLVSFINSDIGSVPCRRLMLRRLDFAFGLCEVALKGRAGH